MTKPDQPVTTPRATTDDSEAIVLDRRRFVQGIGIAVLTVQCLPLTAHAAGHPPEGDDLIVQSGPGAFGHVMPPRAVQAPAPPGCSM